ncbi:MAG: ribonuclease domain-containing protein, partial [Clostridia bacterium]
WDNHKVTLDMVAPGKSIGGSHFGNYEDQLPKAKGRSWRECDIDASNGRRGVKRIVYSSDGLIYYTGNHYKTFERVD